MYAGIEKLFGALGGAWYGYKGALTCVLRTYEAIRPNMTLPSPSSPTYPPHTRKQVTAGQTKENRFIDGRDTHD